MTAPLTPGSSFGGRYEIVRLLSQGGMGAVYEVIHGETRRRRALKVMLAELVGDEAMRRRFLLEARVTAEVDSENLVETFDAGIEASTGQPFLVMELLKGEELGSRMDRESLGWQEALAILEQVARGLDKTHAANIVHRDLKPENVFLTTREDGSLLVKILDFGIAKVLSDSAGKKTTRSVGTPLYIAPETLHHTLGAISAAVDRYALAHMAYAMLVSEAYFETEGRETESIIALLAIIARGPTELPTLRARQSGVVLPPAFDEWFLRAANARPDLRFPTCREQIQELRSLCEKDPPARGPRPSTDAKTASDDGSTLVVPAPVAAVSGLSPVLLSDGRKEEGPPIARTHVSTPNEVSPKAQTKDFSVEIESAPRAAALSRRGIAVVAVVALAGAVAAVLFTLRPSGTVAPVDADEPVEAVGSAPRAAPPSAVTVSVEPSSVASVADSSAPVVGGSAVTEPLASAPAQTPTQPKPKSGSKPLPKPSARPLSDRDCAVDPSRCR